MRSMIPSPNGDNSPSYTEKLDSILLLEKTNFPSDPHQLMEYLGISHPKEFRNMEMKPLSWNDVYYRFLLYSNGFETAKVTVIHPATQLHIDKYTRQERTFIAETPEMYERVVKPYIRLVPATRLQWVYNILEGQSEADMVLYADRDPTRGFYLLPDSKWDQKNLEALYLLVLTMDRGIRTIRDLNESHLEMLEDIKKQVERVVKERYGVEGKELKMFVHYQPTYYHFHVHVVRLEYEDSGTALGKAYLLEDIIDNIKNIANDYYLKKTLHYTLGTEHLLFPLLSTNKI